MRDGIFTEIKRAANPVTISQVARNGLLIGPPVRVEKKQKLFTWITEGTILKLNVPSTGTVADYAISQKLKMADTDLIAAKEDLKLYLSKADGTDEIILAEAASTTVGELKKGVGTAFLTEYNDITTPDNTILTMDKEMGWLLKMDCDTDKTVDIALYSGELYTISDAGAHTQIADNIDSVAVGDTFVQPARADVAITGFAELSAGVSVTCTSAAHGLTSEDTITISGTALAVFDGIFVVTVLTDATFSILTAATAGVETGVFATAERYAKITSIDTSTNEIVVRKISTDFQAETALTGWNIYYDYFGSTTGDQRNPLIKYSIEALRPSVSGRHYISSIEDITDLFGAGSIDDADSILAYDAYYYYLTSNTKFTIYVMEVNTTTPESGQTMSINTTAIATALGKMNALTGYFIVPCYRVSVAADIATIESILETVLAWTNTRSSINSKKEGRVYGALPILNRGYGYTAANIVTIPALDLSDSKTSIYIDCGTDPQEDVYELLKLILKDIGDDDYIYYECY